MGNFCDKIALWHFSEYRYAAKMTKRDKEKNENRLQIHIAGNKNV